MGIKVEFNPDLALRNITEHKNGKRKIEECIPENLEVGKVYDFLKRQSLIKCDKNSFFQLAKPASLMAEAEGLTAHQLSIDIRKL